MANNTGKGTFVKGDPRINRKGKPKNFDGMRKLAQLIGNELDPIKSKTLIEIILREWAKSKNPAFQKAFVEIAYGKVPDNLQISGPEGKPIKIIEIIKDHREA